MHSATAWRLAAVAPWFPPTFTSSGTSSTRAFSRAPWSVASPMATDIRCGVGTHQPVGAAMRALRLLQPIAISGTPGPSNAHYAAAFLKAGQVEWEDSLSMSISSGIVGKGMGLRPQRAGSRGRVNTSIFPPHGFIAAAMGLTIMAPTQGHGKLIADLAA
jgi:hypothetical protein